MILNLRLIYLICLVFLLISCKIEKKSNSSNTAGQSKGNKTTLEQNYPYRPSTTLKNDLINTVLEVSFDWQKQHLNGTAKLRFKPYFYPQDSLILDAKGMDIHSVKLEGANSKPLVYSYDKLKLRIKLDKVYTRTDTFNISIKYTSKPNELPKGGSAAITSDKGLYFINPLGTENKPQQIWTQGETEAASCWFPTIDTPNEKTTQEMFITVDQAFSVLSNGKFMGSKSNPDGTKTEHWRQDLPHAPYLFMMAIGKYAIVKDKWKNLDVDYYVEPEYSQYAKDIFGNTPEMLEFFSNTLGYKYPWDKYSQVIVRDYVSGAMENTSATIFMDALQQDDRALLDDNWDFIIAHELFHHWFGDLVTCESWSNLPLNESFANYSEYLWAEHKYGRDEADYHGANEADEYFDEAKKKQVPLIRFHYNDREDMFDRHSYNKGGRVLHMLRNYVGDEAFFASLKLYLSRNQFKTAEIHNLRLAFEEVTGEDLNWFFNQWFLSPGHPELKVSHSYANGILKLQVNQTQDSAKTPIYKLPVKIDIWVNGIKTTKAITINKAEEIFEFAVPAAPNLVVFDSDFQLLADIKHHKSQEELIFQYNSYPERFLAREEAISVLFVPHLSNEHLKMPFDNAQVKEVLFAALNDSFWVIRKQAVEQLSLFTIPEPIQKEVLEKIKIMAQNDKKPSVRAKAIALLSFYQPKQNIEIYKEAMASKPYTVAGAGLSAYLKSGDKSEVIDFKEWEKINNINVIIPLASYFIESNTPGKYEWFTQKLKTGTPRVVYNLMGYLKIYVLEVDKSKLEDAKLVLKDISENNKYDQIKNVAKAILNDLNEKSK